MRVFISVDMEGVAGVVHEDQTDPIEPRFAADYHRFRRLMTLEANAAIEGAIEAGASYVLVNDSHWLMRNLLAEELHEAAELLSGNLKPRSMVEGIQLGFDAALCIGYHGRAGTPGSTIDHTYTSRVHAARLNGRPVGELALNAALAGTYGVPVALVSGDQSIAAEAEADLGDHVETVVVKEAVGRFAARSIAPAIARRRIRQGVVRALGRPHPPLVVASPATIEVTFQLTQMAEMAELVPGSVRVDGRTVSYTHPDYREVFRAWRAMVSLSAVQG
ncbi:MAG TPA: M55 family metallopeptidase [Gemmatimonadales bacterium]|nr:M55 family metallopeptidase [Gemmatimonadales bacterium]